MLRLAFREASTAMTITVLMLKSSVPCTSCVVTARLGASTPVSDMANGTCWNYGSLVLPPVRFAHRSQWQAG